MFLHIVYEFELKYEILHQSYTLFDISFEMTLLRPCVINILQGVFSAL